MGGVDWLEQGRIMIIKVSFVIIDGVHWEQNVGMLVWLGRNDHGLV